MSLETPALLDALDSVTAIPIIPFDGDRLDYHGHARNVDYLLQHNYLDGNRKRVISIAGTSLIHHLDDETQIRLTDQTTRQIGDQGVYIAGIVPNPLPGAGRLIESLADLQRPPDAYLLMPLSGISNPDGIYSAYMRFADRIGSSCGARFLYYFRQSKECDAVIRLVRESPHFIGVKVGTGVDDVRPLLEGIGDSGIVIWGIGDRCTAAAELGTKGHTSGIALLWARASDEINNAQRRGDYATSRRIEEAIAPLEEIRFRDGRVYNYAAVVEAMNRSGFDDIVGGSGGPFNPPVPAAVGQEVAAALQGLADYH